MRIFTENDIKNMYTSRSINESVCYFSNRYESTYSHFDIFLSHRFIDKDIINTLYNHLTSMGLRVYVDWIVDPNLDRSNVTRESAELIRNRMRNSSSLIYAISANAEMSRWMPWELGYVDGHTQKCVIMPIAKYSFQDYTKMEYLKLYPYIEMNSQNEAITVNDNNQYIDLKNWLRE